MKLILYLCLFFLILINLYFFTYSVRHGEIHFFNDVARDFLLLREIDAKKIMLIGPRSNVSGLFHGPLWSYINYPAYLIGNGNPVVVGWFWILLAVFSLGIGFYGAKKLFGTLPALTFILLYSSNLITHINGMFHSDAPIYLTPLLFFSIVLYTKYKKIRYLALHLFILTMIIQLNVGVGIPMLILTILLTVYLIFKNKSWKHLFTFLAVPLLLSNFILFDIRHNFLLTKSAYAFSQFQRTWHPLSYDFWLRNRLETTIDLHVTQSQNVFIISFIFCLVAIATIKELNRSRKYKIVYILITYYYLGYMLLSFFNKGVILSHFVYFLIPLTTLWFASFLRRNYQLVFLPILGVAIFFNMQHALSYIHNLQTSFFEKVPWSWRSTNRVAESVIARQGKNPFGYFVFSPDAFAYGPRYAMIYHFKAAGVETYEYTKKPITYIIASPPPDNDPYMTHVWWRKNPVKITSEPVWTGTFPDGYTVEEFHLTEKEQLIPHDKTIELGIHFR